MVDEGTQRALYLPKGEWVDYWTGSPISGGKTVVVDAASRRASAICAKTLVIAKIPEDVMTLVPQKRGAAIQHGEDAG